jgi:N-acetylmuramoyl-L-alanine amidase
MPICRSTCSSRTTANSSCSLPGAPFDNQIIQLRRHLALCPLLILVICTGISSLLFAQTRPTALRDITVAMAENSATITFLVDGSVSTVVVEPKGEGMAQIRMKSMKADKTALGSARLKPGLRSVRAHIERTDVLVTNVEFSRTVSALNVIRRSDEEVVVQVRLGSASLPAAEASTGKNTTKQPISSPATGDKSRYNRKQRWALSTIVIDAGHGGKDPGTTGIDSVQEKDITLPVSKMLREELEQAMPGVRVVLTRDKDEFIGLEERSEIANKSGGRLFISIHCNAMPDKPNPRNGFECYILRPGRSDDAARVAAAENDVIRYEANREKYDRHEAEIVIMSTMAQNAFARYSEEAAHAISNSLSKSSGIKDRGVHQAGFYVLVGTAMPSVLLELGYLTNEKDKKALTNKWVQRRIARAIARGIRNYEKNYKASLQ